MKKLINDGWEFKKLPSGSTWEEAREDSGWTAVDLPHDWLIYGENGLYESADAWYRRRIEIPENAPPVCMIRFDGVYMDCDVYLNGTVAARHAYGYTAFDADLGGKILFCDAYFAPLEQGIAHIERYGFTAFAAAQQLVKQFPHALIPSRPRRSFLH